MFCTIKEKMDYSRKYKYSKGTTCSLGNCDREAEYEVILYDYYNFNHETFYEQDYTCPFLCEEHMKQNELHSKGERRARGHVSYPYTNKHGAQGYSKYNPIKEVYPQLFDSTEIENSEHLQIDLQQINDELISYLARNPEYMRHLHPRKFEELIANLFENRGYEVTLTPPTKDGGKDIIAVYKSPFGHQMFIVECTRIVQWRT